MLRRSIRSRASTRRISQNTFPKSRVLAYARTHDNLILTPHIGRSTHDAWFETERFVIEKAARALGAKEGA